MSARRRDVVQAADRVRAALVDLVLAIEVEDDELALRVAAEMSRAMAHVPMRAARLAEARREEVLLSVH